MNIPSQDPAGVPEEATNPVEVSDSLSKRPPVSPTDHMLASVAIRLMWERFKGATLANKPATITIPTEDLSNFREKLMDIGIPEANIGTIPTGTAHTIEVAISPQSAGILAHALDVKNEMQKTGWLSNVTERTTGTRLVQRPGRS